jgi:lipopolysaccharide transport system ATP-binding protein
LLARSRCSLTLGTHEHICDSRRGHWKAIPDGGGYSGRGLHEAVDRWVKHPFRAPQPPANGRKGFLWALKDISFEVDRGEVVGLVGSNGAGKSVLLRILSRITAPSEGRAEVFGQVGPLLEVGAGFHPELNGRENVYFNGAILGMTREHIRRKFDEIVAFSELESFIHTPIKLYSSGMRMRLAFSVAVHLEPEILMIDEALAVGDAGFRAKCRRKIREFIADGCTLILVSHDSALVAEICRRAIWLRHGRMLQDGKVEDVLANYRAQEGK